MNIGERTLLAATCWISMLALTLAVLSPGLSGEFFFDDNPNIVENEAIHIQSLSMDSLRSSIAGPEAGPLGRPVSVMSFALTHYFFGLDPYAFKAVNLAIHAVNGMLVVWLVSLLLQRTQLAREERQWLPLWVAATWLVHPINIMPVMLSVQRMTLLSGLFMLLALIAHLQGVSRPAGERANWKWLAAGWLVFWPLSVMSKETGLLFPLYVLAVTLFSEPRTAHRHLVSNWVIPASVVSLSLIAIAMLSYIGLGWLEAGYAMRSFTLFERLLTETRVLWFYAAQIVIPDYAAFGVYLDDFNVSTGIIHPTTTLAGLVGWGAAFVGIWHFRHRQPFLCFAVTWFLVGHSLESTFLPLEIAHEYRNYIPSLGLIIGVGYLGALILPKLKLDHRSMTIGLAAIVPVLVLALLTWTRAEQLGNHLVGTQTEANRHPQSARANHAAAVALIKAGYGDKDDPIGAQSIKYYLLQAEAVDPTVKLGYLALIIWACSSERPLESQWIEGLSLRLEHTPFSPGDRKLPESMLKPMLSIPKCLDRQDALRLFEAGANNPGISNSLRAGFLGAAADYELLVSRDLVSSHNYLAKAAALVPYDPATRRKLESFEMLQSAKIDSASKNTIPSVASQAQ